MDTIRRRPEAERSVRTAVTKIFAFKGDRMLTVQFTANYTGRLYVKVGQKGGNLDLFDPESWQFNLLRKANQVPKFFDVTAKVL